MSDQKDFVTLEVGKALKHFKYFKNCPYKFSRSVKVADKILLMHPGLSDDGYMDLLKEYGGKYERNEVYESVIEIVKYPFTECYGPAPRLYDVQKWLRKVHKVYLYVIRDHYHNKFRFEFTNDKQRGTFTSACYDEYEDAMNAGILEVIEHCKSRNILNKDDYEDTES